MIHESYTITLRVQPGDPRPGAVRLRRLLKFALRALGLKCINLSGGPEAERIPGTDLEMK